MWRRDGIARLVAKRTVLSAALVFTFFSARSPYRGARLFVRVPYACAHRFIGLALEEKILVFSRLLANTVRRPAKRTTTTTAKKPTDPYVSLWLRITHRARTERIMMITKKTKQKNRFSCYANDNLSTFHEVVFFRFNPLNLNASPWIGDAIARQNWSTETYGSYMYYTRTV